MKIQKDISNFFSELKPLKSTSLSIFIDKDSFYHLEHRDSVHARTTVFITTPEIKSNNLSFFGKNIVGVNFTHTSLLDAIIDEDDVMFGRLFLESEEDCFYPECEFPIKMNLINSDGSIIKKDICDLFSEESSYLWATGILKEYIPYKLLEECIEKIDLSDYFSDKVISKLLWP